MEKKNVKEFVDKRKKEKMRTLKSLYSWYLKKKKKKKKRISETRTYSQR